MLPRLINELWMVSGLANRASFLRSTRRVVTTQSDYLMQLVHKNKHADFGRQHRFDQLSSVEDYQRRVPIRSYDEFTPWIQAILSGRDQVLTAGPVLLLQPTSGTISGRKLIPFTNDLANEFQRAVNVWTCDLLLKHPRVRGGTAYWSISPAVMHASAADSAELNGKVPIGFASDLSYVGFLQRQLAGRLMAVPMELGTCTDIEQWRFWTLFHLLRAQDLTLISVWSPTFLIALMTQLDQLAPALIETLAVETRDPITGRTLPGKPRLASQIGAVLQRHESALSAITKLWPRLSVVSCWADAASTDLAKHLQQHLPDVALQPKGLMSTEACITFPLNGYGHALAYQSHFFEFELLDSPSSILLAHELNIGQQYQVLLTTGGGLYRYRTHDVVEVTGFINRCPLLRFVGRNNQTCDMVGEKLSECFVRSCLLEAMRAVDASGLIMMLVPSRSEFLPTISGSESSSGTTAHWYCLVVSGPLSANKQSHLLDNLERCLSENVYYRHARVHGQLQPLQLIHLPETGQLAKAYNEYCLSRNQRLADIKLTNLECGSAATAFVPLTRS